MGPYTAAAKQRESQNLGGAAESLAEVTYHKHKTGRADSPDCRICAVEKKTRYIFCDYETLSYIRTPQKYLRMNPNVGHGCSLQRCPTWSRRNSRNSTQSLKYKLVP